MPPRSRPTGGSPPRWWRPSPSSTWTRNLAFRLRADGRLRYESHDEAGGNAAGTLEERR
ncbi:hypothetical protein [Streptomyces sp. RKND-216]|uniref:hypothetical protein n=1 Tax=Streptomyces sp. RKND-216 TaxID=2562581 RepID=UPI001FF75F24|nr:hypothetical protein [Streptomyces sp. RKND-216]